MISFLLDLHSSRPRLFYTYVSYHLTLSVLCRSLTPFLLGFETVHTEFLNKSSGTVEDMGLECINDVEGVTMYTEHYEWVTSN